MNEPTQFKTHEETVAEILGRYSVTDLREMTAADLDRGDKMFEKGGAIDVIATGETNLIRWWKIRTANGEYEVRRFENFVFCSCRDFYFRKTCCRHIVVTLTPMCTECGSRPAGSHGESCEKCSPGGELEVGDHFKIACKSEKKRTVYRVESVSIDGIVCVDISEPDNPSFPRAQLSLRHFQVDGFRELKKFKLLPPNYGLSADIQQLAA